MEVQELAAAPSTGCSSSSSNSSSNASAGQPEALLLGSGQEEAPAAPSSSIASRSSTPCVTPAATAGGSGHFAGGLTAQQRTGSSTFSMSEGGSPHAPVVNKMLSGVHTVVSGSGRRKGASYVPAYMTR